MRIAKPTSVLFVVVLVAVGIVLGRLTPPLFVRLGGTPPRLGWVAPLVLAAGAAGVGALAYSTWQALHRRHERMTADHGIALLALAKSCTVAAALVGGFYGGFALAFVDNLDAMLGRERFVRALVAAAASLALLLAGLLLERACRLPEDDDEDDEGRGTGRSDPTPA